MCNITIMQHRNNASSTLGVNPQQFHAKTGENAVSQTAPGKKENWLLNPVWKQLQGLT